MPENTAVDLLADYLTGPEVAANSIGLAVPDGPMRLRARAERFFALRKAFGVQGYDSKEEAIASITTTLAK